MNYLFAKYALTFILAAIAGFFFGRWITRRKFEAVTEKDPSFRTGSDQSLSAKLDKIDTTIHRSHAPGVDLSQTDERLRAIELALNELRNDSGEAGEDRARQASPFSGETTILEEARFGEKDDLRRISGIGSKLERLLNRNGIFYFWQIANWTDSDIELMDQRLDIFKGRIGRDEWVSQAGRLCSEPGSAQQPTEMRISA